MLEGAGNDDCRGQLKCDGTRAETRFRLSPKWTSPFKSEVGGGGSVQSTTGNRGVRISGRNTGYTMVQGNVKSTGYPLHSPVSPPVRHRVPSHFNWSLQRVKEMAPAVMDSQRKCTRAVWKLSSHFEYLENRSRGLHVTWQPVRGDLIVHSQAVTLPLG